MSDVAGQDPVSFPIRPLSKGMRTNIPSQALTDGGGVDVRNYHVTTNGLRPRAGIQPVIPTSPFGAIPVVEQNEVIIGVETYFSIGGSKNIIAITNHHLYKTTDFITWETIAWVRPYTVTSVDSGLRTVTINTTGYDFDDDATGDRVKIGMYAELTDGTNTSRHAITNVASGVITLATWPTFTPNTGAGALKIYRNFSVNDPFTVQWAVTPVGMFFVDGTSNGVYRVWDGGTGAPLYMSEHICHNGVDTATRVFSGAVSIAYVSGRIIVGSPYENSGRQRIRWSSLLNINSFDPRDYTDCAQARGTVLRVTNIEDYPVVILTDSIYVGQPYGFNAPDASMWIFRPVQMGGMSAVGPDAFTQIPNGLVFLAKDDYHLLSPLKRNEKGDFMTEPMRCPIFNTFLKNNTYLYKAKLVWDTVEQRICTALYDNDKFTFSKILSYYSATQEWSYETYGLSLTSIQDISITTSRLWSDYSATDWDGVPGLTWYATMSGFSLSRMIYTSLETHVYNLAGMTGTDGYIVGGAISQYPIQCLYETGDIDYDKPDQNKSAYKVAIRIGGRVDVQANDLSWAIQFSTDKGRTWKTIGTLGIAPDVEENELHFRGSGTNLRYKYTLNNTEPPFDWEEITYRMRIAGGQVVRGEQ